MLCAPVQWCLRQFMIEQFHLFACDAVYTVIIISESRIVTLNLKIGDQSGFFITSYILPLRVLTADSESARTLMPATPKDI